MTVHAVPVFTAGADRWPTPTPSTAKDADLTAIGPVVPRSRADRHGHEPVLRRRLP